MGAGASIRVKFPLANSRKIGYIYSMKVKIKVLYAVAGGLLAGVVLLAGVYGYLLSRKPEGRQVAEPSVLEKGRQKEALPVRPRPTYPLPSPFSPSKQARDKILFLRDLMKRQVPLGVWLKERVEDGGEETRFILSGILTQKPRWEGKKAYLSLALQVDEQGKLSKVVEVLLGEADEEIGSNIATGGAEANIYEIRKVKEIVPLLLPLSQVKLTLWTKIDKAVLQEPECNEYCQRIVPYVNDYGQEIEPYLFSLMQGEFKKPPQPLGVVAEIVFPR